MLGGLVRRGFASEAAVNTSLYDFHVENGGKMINFGGFMLPVQYADQSISESHLFTRKSASLFDVSHMLQTEIRGEGCLDYLETIVTANLRALKVNSSVLTVFTNEAGGILDDLIITKIEDDHLFVVSNAGRKDHDQAHMLRGLEAHRSKNKDCDIRMRFFEPRERALIALQGPQAADCLQSMTDVDLSQLYFMTSTVASVAGVQGCRITRCGYTGEDGFEISIPAILSMEVSREILKDERVKLAGLGARDTLRLEAGLCLYGSDITEKTTPVQAGLTWLVDKTRRERKDFPGAEAIVKEIKEGSKTKRVGLISEGGPPARHDAVIADSTGSKDVGTVTSGCPAPSLSKNVAMGYVQTEYSKPGTELSLKIRGKIYKAVVAKMPFLPAKYYNKPKM